jgi:hypothetical protein
MVSKFWKFHRLFIYAVSSWTLLFVFWQLLDKPFLEPNFYILFVELFLLLYCFIWSIYYFLWGYPYE